MIIFLVSSHLMETIPISETYEPPSSDDKNDLVPVGLRHEFKNHEEWTALMTRLYKAVKRQPENPYRNWWMGVPVILLVLTCLIVPGFSVVALLFAILVISVGCMITMPPSTLDIVKSECRAISLEWYTAKMDREIKIVRGDDKMDRLCILVPKRYVS